MDIVGTRVDLRWVIAAALLGSKGRIINNENVHSQTSTNDIENVKGGLPCKINVAGFCFVVNEIRRSPIKFL